MTGSCAPEMRGEVPYGIQSQLTDTYVLEQRRVQLDLLESCL